MRYNVFISAADTIGFTGSIHVQPIILRLQLYLYIKSLNNQLYLQYIIKVRSTESTVVTSFLRLHDKLIPSYDEDSVLNTSLLLTSTLVPCRLPIHCRVDTGLPTSVVEHSRLLPVSLSHQGNCSPTAITLGLTAASGIYIIHKFVDVMFYDVTL